MFTIHPCYRREIIPEVSLQTNSYILELLKHIAKEIIFLKSIIEYDRTASFSRRTQDLKTSDEHVDHA
jgi:hypothetical protein